MCFGLIRSLMEIVTNKELCDYLSTHNFGPELEAVSAPEVITFYLR